MKGGPAKLAGWLAIAAFAMPVYAQQYGPAILSRGDAPASMASTQVDFHPFVNIAGIYAAGLSGVFYNSQGTTLGNISSEGIQLSFGVSGLHSWKHTKLGLDYVGSISHYSNTAIFGNLQNQSFLLSLTRQIGPHAVFTLREDAQIASQPIASPSLPQTVAFDPASAYNPTTDFYDNRTIFLTQQASFVFQKSARLSFDLGGLGSLTERQAAGLYSITGAGASADAQYRLTSHSTFGATYNYTHFVYHGTFNATDVQTVSGTYATRFTRSLEFSGYAGVSNSQTKFLSVVPIDPAIAILIGLSSATVIRYGSIYHPTYGGRLSQTFQHGVLFLSCSYAVTPGNGLFLTSTAFNVSSGYNYTSSKTWALGLTTAYSRAESVANVVGEYGGYSGGFSASRKLRNSLHLTAAANAYKYESATFAGYNRLTYSASLGLAFSPGNVPLRVW
jgi:hypothetical protein